MGCSERQSWASDNFLATRQRPTRQYDNVLGLLEHAKNENFLILGLKIKSSQGTLLENLTDDAHCDEIFNHFPLFN